MRKLLLAALPLAVLGAVVLATSGGGGPADQGVTQLDSAAQAHAVKLAAQIESCFARTRDYAACTPAGRELDLAGLRTTGAERVEVTDAIGTSGYSLTAHSKSGHTFTIQKTGSGTTRTCAWGAGEPSGGCTGPAW